MEEQKDKKQRENTSKHLLQVSKYFVKTENGLKQTITKELVLFKHCRYILQLQLSAN